MSDDESQLIKKITSHEADLIEIYRAVYPILRQVDPAGLPENVVKDIQNLEFPDTIAPSKAAAIGS